MALLGFWTHTDKQLKLKNIEELCSSKFNLNIHCSFVYLLTQDDDVIENLQKKIGVLSTDT